MTLRLLLIPALALTALFALLLAGFHAQPQPDAIPAYFGACAMPCWESVQPGITSRVDALALLNAANAAQPISPPCFSLGSYPCELYEWNRPGSPAIQLQIERDQVATVAARAPGFSVGEALLMLRGLRGGLSSVELGYNIDTFYVWLMFARSSVGVSAEVECPASYLTLMQTPVDTVVLQPGQDDPISAPPSYNLLRRTFSKLCEE